MQRVERMSRKAVAMGKDAAKSVASSVRELRWNDVTKCMKRYPVQTLVTLTAVGFLTGFVAARK